MRDADIEAALEAKNKDGKRVTPAMLEEEIASEAYYVWPGTTLTMCLLTLKNGFSVTGESACAVPANFDAELGRKIARENAKNKLWPLLGFRLRDALHAEYLADKREIDHMGREVLYDDSIARL